jgi:integrase/recombinase XerD
MDWSSGIKGFRAYLMLERSLSKHSVDAYSRDVKKLAEFAITELKLSSPLQLEPKNFESFIVWINEFGIGAATQARILSGIRAFYKYLLIEDLIEDDPTDLMEGPKMARKIPEVLSYEEIEKVLKAIDLSNPLGHRNRAILETLYACGLRASELISLRLSNIIRELGVIKIIGKNNKERIVPIGEEALKHIDLYLENTRRHLPSIDAGSRDIVFLNRRGKKMSRVMLFTIVRSAVKAAQIEKTVSPHTFRHSFATHLVEGGANLKAVQDMLGHESITTTEIYTHMNTEFLRQTVLMYHPRNILQKDN